MSKYTMTIEEYCIGRFLAGRLDQDPSYPPALAPLDITPGDAYDIVEAEIFPATVPFYSDDPGMLREFIEQWTDTFYFDEIGQETVGKFAWTLRAWLRTNMDKYTQLYASDVANVADLMEQNDYARDLTDTLERTGTETHALLHGHTVTDTPTTTVTNKIIPLGGSAETELNQSVDGGTVTHGNTGTDTTTITPNTTDTRTVHETIIGYQGVDKARVYEAYRGLIQDLNSDIFAQMRRDNLFMNVW